MNGEFAMHIDEAKAKELPMQSLGVLCMVNAGLLVRSLMSQPTYSKHRAILKAHGFDIHEQVVMREKLAG